MTGHSEGYTVLIGDACGTRRAYHVMASSSIAACAFAQRVFEQHSSMHGEVIACMQGEPVFEAISGRIGDANGLPIIIPLYPTDEDAA